MTECYIVYFWNKHTRETKVYKHSLELCEAKSIARHFNKVDTGSIYWIQEAPRRYW